MKRITSILLAVVLMLSLLTVPAFAQSHVKKSVTPNSVTGEKETTTYRWNFVTKTLTISGDMFAGNAYLPLIDYSKIKEHPLLIVSAEEEIVFAYNEDILSGKITKVIRNYGHNNYDLFKFTVKDHRLIKMTSQEHIGTTLNHTTVYTYNEKGQISSYGYPDYLCQIEYDAAGHPLNYFSGEITWENDKLVSYTYAHLRNYVLYDKNGNYIGEETQLKDQRVIYQYSGDRLKQIQVKTTYEDDGPKTYTSVYSY